MIERREREGEREKERRRYIESEGEIRENYHRKLLQKIITENYYRKLSASI